MLIERVSLLPPLDDARFSSIEAKNEISKLGGIKDETFKNMLVKAIASRYEIHEIEDVQNVANSQGAQAIQQMQKMQDIQRIQQVQEMQQIQQLQSIQQIKNI